jgi:S-(hydroxymethyl)glutathione dehydrogenase/alcohol dehydrogenase
MSAVQGACHAGASHVIVVDPAEFKREVAKQFGATASFSHIDEAADFARSLTNGQGADSTIITVGRVRGERIPEALKSVRKAGTVVVTSQGAWADENIALNLYELSMYQKRIQGVVYGNASPRRSMQLMLDLYRTGQLRLDEMVTRRYSIEGINEATADMRNARNIRGVIELA